MNQPIIIVGFMGSGKTTVARELARILDCAVVDLDQLIKERVGRTAREIIEQDGEPAFREVETRTLREVLKEGVARVIALGGGAWIQKINREIIVQHQGFSVWIDVPFDVCWRRIEAAGSERPLAPNKEEARKLFEERRSTYELAALRVAVAENKSNAESALVIANAVQTTAEERTAG